MGSRISSRAHGCHLDLSHHPLLLSQHPLQSELQLPQGIHPISHLPSPYSSFA